MHESPTNRASVCAALLSLFYVCVIAAHNETTVRVQSDHILVDPRELVGTRTRFTLPLPRHCEIELPWCVPRLNLNDDDRSEITSSNLLNDKVINAFQTMLSDKFALVRGWQSPAVAVFHEIGYEFTAAPSVQIHHNSRLHWLTSARTSAGIFVADSRHSQPTIATGFAQMSREGYFD